MTRLDQDHIAGLCEGTVIRRVGAVLAGVDLDCGCRAKLEAALRRFASFERRRQLRRCIVDAREQVERIVALLDFLRELDEVGADEADLAVFTEIELLFETIRSAAARGQRDMAAARLHRESAAADGGDAP